MLNKKDLNNLEGVFMLSAVNNFGGKRKASEALGTSIDTISKYIENLEATLGVKLIYSDDRGTKLTVDGRRILKCMAKMDEALYDIYKMSGDRRKVRGEVRVAMNLGVRAYMRGSGLKEFFEKYPELSVVVVATDGDPDMRNHSFDLGICYDLAPDSNLVLICRKKILCGFFASAEYLAKHGYPKDREDMMKNHKVIIKYHSNTMTNAWKGILDEAVYKVYGSNSLWDINDVVRNGVGIGVMPLYFAEDGIVCLDNIKCPHDLYFNLVARADTKDIPKNRAVIDFYKEQLEAM